MPSPSELLWGVLFGSIGVGYMMYGKRQQRPVPFWCGLGLIVAPYLVSSTLLMVLLSLALMVLPYFLRG